MKSFKYRAKAEDGTTVSGVIEAYDEYEAVDRIRRTYPVVENIKPIKKERRINIDINEPLWVSDKTLALTANQFCIMLRAGMQMARVVEIIAEQTSDKLMKRYLRASAADVAAGYSLAGSLEKNGKKIPAVFIETVRAGEESGTLEKSFRTLEQYYSRSHKTKKKVKSALTYPILVLIVAAVVIGIVMVVLVPRMTSTLQSVGGELPLPTRILIGISNFFKRAWYIVLIALAVIIIAFYAYGRTEKGKMAYSRIKIRMPVIGRITRMNAAAQTANTLSTLIAAGLPLSRALEITSRVIDSKCVGEELNKAVTKLESGSSLGEALKDSVYLPDMLKEMIVVGEQAGSLEETLATIGTYFNDEATSASDAALAMIEPMITIILGVVVGFIVIAIYVPVFTMSTSVGG